ncbi:hypothetical protein [Krasilnikovia sp. MM14-A1259]|uniref:hypothetical protein n=1 Tax=Krasilnikovia sp. MM14-A1259 TaxID=3373539 RepID=UPI003825C4CC
MSECTERSEGRERMPSRASMTDIRAALREWVVARNPGLDPETLTEHTPLISSRLVTSLHIVELLLFIEELRAAPVDPRSLAPGAFADIGTIAQAFFAPDETHATSGAHS